MPVTSPGLVLAATRSGAGKTSLMAGILTALRRRGVRVGPAKCGSDFIDPGLHWAASGRLSRNLDTWAMSPGLFAQVRSAVESDVQLVICEGVMGLFDGHDPGEAGLASGSTAAVALKTGWPVVLVMDVAGLGQSAGALAKGFATYHPGVKVVGVICNRVASERHGRMCEHGIAATGLRFLGAIPRGDDLKLAERHLGLVQACEHSDLQPWLDRLADVVSRHVDIEGLCALAEPGSPVVARGPVRGFVPHAARIALAADDAFSFIYPHVLDGWYAAGVSIARFSPLADESPPEDADLCWLPGGYPELHAGRLADNHRFLDGLRAFAKTRPVHGECGGYMVLGQYLEDADGGVHRMAGLLSHSTSFRKRKLNIGYRRARLARSSALGERSQEFRGHEFHYSTVSDTGDDSALFSSVEGVKADCIGSQRGHVSGSFFHLIDVGAVPEPSPVRFQ